MLFLQLQKGKNVAERQIMSESDPQISVEKTFFKRARQTKITKLTAGTILKDNLVSEVTNENDYGHYGCYVCTGSCALYGLNP